MKLTEEQIKERLAALDGWRRASAELVRDYQFENFKRALEFVNRVAEIAESIDHHPDILIHGWNKVRVSVTTHSVGSLTARDFTLAEQINQLT